MKHILFAVILAGLMLTGCGGSHSTTTPVSPVTPPTVPAAPAPTPTATITATPAGITVSQSTTLTWATTNATDITIDAIGPVAASGSQVMVPTQTTTYHLTAKGDGGTTQATALVTVTQPPPAPLPNIACWGDSLTAGSGGDGTTYPAVLAQLTNLNVYSGGVGGQGSTQIAARMLSATDKFGDVTVIWAGRNNFTDQSQVLSDTASMMNALSEPKQFLVLSILNGGDEPAGSIGYNQIVSLNNALAAAYPNNFLDIRSYIVSQYKSDNALDATQHALDTEPPSLVTKDDAGTLGTSIGTGDISFSLTCPTGECPYPGVIIQIDSEYFMITEATGSNPYGVTVTRAYAGSTAAPHTSGTPYSGWSTIHLNAAGYTAVAQKVAEWLKTAGYISQ